jgi:hypothetical protein
MRHDIDVASFLFATGPLDLVECPDRPRLPDLFGRQGNGEPAREITLSSWVKAGLRSAHQRDIRVE